METMNLLDITIKYFNVIVFVMCIIFGMISFFASWVAWREIHHKRNIIRSVIAAYNIAEDTLEKGTTRDGQLQLDPSIVQTVFNSIQEILNAIHGEVTGKSMPPREERMHGLKKSGGLKRFRKVFGHDEGSEEGLNAEHEVPVLVPDERERPHGAM
jgi:hypothetical protein